MKNYTKNLEDVLKSKKQINDVADQTEAQEQITTIAEMADKQNDKDVSEVFFIYLCACTHLLAMAFPWYYMHQLLKA